MKHVAFFSDSDYVHTTQMFFFPVFCLPLLCQADTLVQKVSVAQQSVLDALSHIEKLVTESKNTEAGRRLEVNLNILQLASKLQHTIRSIMEAANAMRSGLQATKGAKAAEKGRNAS